MQLLRILLITEMATDLHLYTKKGKGSSELLFNAIFLILTYAKDPQNHSFYYFLDFDWFEYQGIFIEKILASGIFLEFSGQPRSIDSIFNFNSLWLLSILA